MKSKNKLIVLFIIIVVLIVCFILFFIKNKSDSNKEYIPYYVPQSRIDNMEITKVANAVTLGWIQVQGTTIDYPVIKETNEAYSSGEDYIWRISSYITGENREAIFGHNIRNVSNKPLINDPKHVRFETLMNFVYYDFAKENLYINYTYDGVDHLYKIYAVGFVDFDDGSSYTEASEVDKYIAEAKKNSLYKYKVDVNSDDHIISLITCTRYFGIDGKLNFRVDAREVRKDEKITKYSVETTKNYDIIK